jgi:glycosyltransferase involved in cell wall biosynthesis
MANISPESTSDLQKRKALGRSYLNANRVKEGIEVFAALAKDYPDDVEILLILGDLYLGGGDESTALQLYASALKVDPTRSDIIQRIQLAAPEKVGKIAPPAEEVPTDPIAITRLLQRLSGRQTPINEAEIERAADLLNEIVSNPNPAQKVAEHLEEIDALLPALVELNIRQAHSDGRPDLANALLSLQMNINLQISSGRETKKAQSGNSTVARLKSVAARAQWKILFMVPNEHEIPIRITSLMDALKECGCKVSVADTYLPHSSPMPDIAVLNCPHASQAMMESMAFFTASHIPVIIDIDRDYEEIPIDHPDYQRLGLGTQPMARAYISSLLLANQVIAPNNLLVEKFHRAGYSSRYIPDGWSRQNKLWNRPPSPRNNINIGWLTTTGLKEDLAIVRRVVNRVIREFPQTQLVIAGDPESYQLFEGLPEGRKLYLPPVSVEDYPYLLSQVDILLVPLRNIPFNQTVSDRILMEAGIKRIPWLASPVPAFQDWKAGGLLANTLDEWHTYLRQLVMDKDLRTSLGEAGRQHSAHREMSGVSLFWLEAIEQLLQPSAVQEKSFQQISKPVNVQ